MKNSVVALLFCALTPSVLFGISIPRPVREQARACLNVFRERDVNKVHVELVLKPIRVYRLSIPAKYYLDRSSSLQPVFRMIGRVQNVMKDASPFLKREMRDSLWRITLYRALKPFNMFTPDFRKFELLIDATLKANKHGSFMQFLESQRVSDEWVRKITDYLEQDRELDSSVWTASFTSRNFKFPDVEARVYIPFRGQLDAFGDMVLKLDAENHDLVIEVSSGNAEAPDLERVMNELRTVF